jgi:hypothetical protein
MAEDIQDNMVDLMKDFNKYFQENMMIATYRGIPVTSEITSGNTSTYKYVCYNPLQQVKYVETYVPKQVIYNDRTTVVIWQDDSKTVVKASEGEAFIEEVGFLAALAKKVYGERNKYLKFVKKAYRQPLSKKKVKVNTKYIPDPMFPNVETEEE